MGVCSSKNKSKREKTTNYSTPIDGDYFFHESSSKTLPPKSSGDRFFRINKKSVSEAENLGCVEDRWQNGFIPEVSRSLSVDGNFRVLIDEDKVLDADELLRRNHYSKTSVFVGDHEEATGTSTELNHDEVSSQEDHYGIQEIEHNNVPFGNRQIHVARVHRNSERSELDDDYGDCNSNEDKEVSKIVRSTSVDNALCNIENSHQRKRIKVKTKNDEGKLIGPNEKRQVRRRSSLDESTIGLFHRSESFQSYHSRRQNKNSNQVEVSEVYNARTYKRPDFYNTSPTSICSYGIEQSDFYDENEVSSASQYRKGNVDIYNSAPSSTKHYPSQKTSAGKATKQNLEHDSQAVQSLPFDETLLSIRNLYHCGMESGTSNGESSDDSYHQATRYKTNSISFDDGLSCHRTSGGSDTTSVHFEGNKYKEVFKPSRRRSSSVNDIRFERKDYSSGMPSHFEPTCDIKIDAEDYHPNVMRRDSLDDSLVNLGTFYGSDNEKSESDCTSLGYSEQSEASENYRTVIPGPAQQKLLDDVKAYYSGQTGSGGKDAYNSGALRSTSLSKLFNTADLPESETGSSGPSGPSGSYHNHDSQLGDKKVGLFLSSSLDNLSSSSKSKKNKRFLNREEDISPDSGIGDEEPKLIDVTFSPLKSIIRRPIHDVIRFTSSAENLSCRGALNRTDVAENEVDKNAKIDRILRLSARTIDFYLSRSRNTRVKQKNENPQSAPYEKVEDTKQKQSKVDKNSIESKLFVLENFKKTLNATTKKTNHYLSNEVNFFPTFPIDYDKVKDYKSCRVLGCGSFSQVYKVKDIHTGKNYALKKLHKSHVIKQKVCFQVQQEIEILSKMKNHPFIIELVSYWQTKGYLLQLLPLADNGDLHMLWKRQKKFPLPCIARVAAEISNALQYIHMNHIVYRDLKMENILISCQGHVLLTDFGLAKHMGKLTRTYTICGTLDYIAPEVTSGRGHSYACDWWSLGVVIFCMATGKMPFKAAEDHISMERVIKNRISDLDAMTNEESIKEIVAKLLAYQAADRTGNIKEFQSLQLMSEVSVYEFQTNSEGPLRKYFSAESQC